MRTLTATSWRSTITPMRMATMSIGTPMATTPGTMVTRRIRPRWRGSTEGSVRSRSINGCGRSWSASCTGSPGSAAVALLVLAAVRDPTWAIAYLLLLGAGTVAGMMLITVALAAPFAFSWSRLPRFNWQLRVASGLISLGFGLLLIYEIGFSAGGLFTAGAGLATALTTPGAHAWADVGAARPPGARLFV